MTEKQGWVEVYHHTPALEAGGRSEGYQKLFFLRMTVVKYDFLSPLRKNTERWISECFQIPYSR